MSACCCDPAFSDGDDGFHQQDNVGTDWWRSGLRHCGIAVADDERTEWIILDFFVYCLLKNQPHGESSLEGLNDRVLRARSEFCLIIAELSGRRHAYITNVISFYHFPCEFWLRMARPFFMTCHWQMVILWFDSGSGFLTLFLYTGEILCRLIVMILVTRSTTYCVEIESLVPEVNAAA